MDTIFMNSENSKVFDPQRLLLNVTDKINFKKSDKYVALSNRSNNFTRKNIKSPTWMEEFELPDGSYSV